jgi:hypothetical protein
MRSRRLETRSATTPDTREKSKRGANCKVPSKPSLRGELVSCNTSHDWATVCIHPPVSAANWARKKRRNSR